MHLINNTVRHYGVQARAAYSPSAQVVNNTFQLVKLLLQSWRYAVPLPAPAILAHLQVSYCH